MVAMHRGSSQVERSVAWLGVFSQTGRPLSSARGWRRFMIGTRHLL
jgi:hypothetical protein